MVQIRGEPSTCCGDEGSRQPKMIVRSGPLHMGSSAIQRRRSACSGSRPRHALCQKEVWVTRSLDIARHWRERTSIHGKGLNELEPRTTARGVPLRSATKPFAGRLLSGRSIIRADVRRPRRPAYAWRGPTALTNEARSPYIGAIPVPRAYTLEYRYDRTRSS